MGSSRNKLPTPAHEWMQNYLPQRPETVWFVYKPEFYMAQKSQAEKLMGKVVRDQ